MATAKPRKTFSGGGRRSQAKGIMPPLRDKAGQVTNNYSMPSRPEREAEIKAVVMAQPHRRDAANPDDPWLQDQALRQVIAGRLTVSGLEQWQVEATIKRYTKVVSRKKSVDSSPRGLAVTSGGSGRELDPETAMEWTRDWNDCRIALRDHPRPVRDAVQFLCEDIQAEGWQAPFWVAHNAGIGLLALARLFGIVGR